MSEIAIPEWGAFCVKLLQGPIYKTDSSWRIFENNFVEINSYFNKMGLTVFWDRADDYAVLKQLDDDSFVIQEHGQIVNDEERITNEYESLKENFPHLLKKVQLGFDQSIICVLLREELERFDSSTSASPFLTMRESEIRERFETFAKDVNDKKKQNEKFKEDIDTLEKLRFITELYESKKDTSQNKDREFRILPIIKAKISLDFLREFKEKLLQAKGEDANSNENFGDFEIDGETEAL